MVKKIPKIIENSNHYHLWTDVLHARELARQAENKWDSAAYVRWTVIIAWIALEIACSDSLESPNISYRFKENLDDAISNKSFSKIDWGQGTWQKVSQLQNTRKNFVHRFISEKDLFPYATIANETIETVREAIKDIYSRAGKASPDWVDDDYDRGWSQKIGFKDLPYLTKTHDGANENDENTIKIVFVDTVGEHISDILPPEKDYQIIIDELISNPLEPISEIRIYKGDKMIEKREYNMRGI